MSPIGYSALCESGLSRNHSGFLQTETAPSQETPHSMHVLRATKQNTEERETRLDTARIG